MNKLIAEALGTFFLVFIGISSAAFTAGVNGGIGLMGVSLAFGLTVMAMAYAIGGTSGCHLNPAVTVGLTVAGKFPKENVIQYVIAQVIGGAIGAGLVYCIAKGGNLIPGFVNNGFASNGYGIHSPGNFDLRSVMLMEIVCTFMFVFVICRVTSEKVNAAIAPICIGLTLAAVHFAAIWVSNSSINPARSTATAIYAGGWALDQLWAFWVAPVIGGILGGFVHKRV